MRFLVLGGCGFIGSHVVDRLVAAGHEVSVISRRGEVFRRPVAGVEYRMADLRDPVAVGAALDGCDCVIHAFSATTPGSGDADPAFDISANLLPSLNVLDGMVAKGVRRLVFLSSGGTVYGDAGAVPTPESSPLAPICSYGIVKVAIESYIALHARNHGLLPVILRPSNTFGARHGRDGSQGLVNTVLRRVLTGETVEIWGDGSIIRDHLYVEDLARLVVLAGEGSATGVFNAGTGVGTSVRDLVDLISDVAGRRTMVRFTAQRAVDVPISVLDATRAREVLGWVPEVDLREGLERTLDWHRWWLRQR